MISGMTGKEICPAWFRSNASMRQCISARVKVSGNQNPAWHNHACKIKGASDTCHFSLSLPDWLHVVACQAPHFASLKCLPVIICPSQVDRQVITTRWHSQASSVIAPCSACQGEKMSIKAQVSQTLILWNVKQWEFQVCNRLKLSQKNAQLKFWLSKLKQTHWIASHS